MLARGRVLVCCVLLGVLLMAAGTAEAAPGRHKGELYFFWGYNWSVYSESDIHFNGPGYDFTLSEVTAHDRQTSFSAGTYLNPTRLTIPQYELRLGYYLGQRTSISLGMSHLKYVMTPNQGSTITGTIDASASAEFAGVYDNELIQLSPDFLQFEHTDGLNYTAVEVETMVPVWESSGQTQGIYLTVAAGAGIVTPKSNVTLFGQERSDRLNLAGWGLNTKIGLKYEFLKRFFVQGFINVGWLDLSDIPTRAGGLDVADQSLYFLEEAFVAGMSVYTF